MLFSDETTFGNRGALIDIIIIITLIKTLIDKEVKNFKDNGLLMFRHF